MPQHGPLQHGSVAARDGAGVLLLGPPGSGKSDLLLRLLDVGWTLVADDQVLLRDDGARLLAAAPDPLRGMLEVRGLGLLCGFPTLAETPLALAVDCVARGDVPRLPHPARFQALGRAIPRIALFPGDASTPRRIALALDVLAGHLTCTAGALEWTA